MAAANTATARRGIALASPQNVTGPPAAAANSRVAAGAVPMPRVSRSATSGISNSSGTLISSPMVAAMATPPRSLPRYRDTVSGLIHWMTSPDSAPAASMIGPIRTTYPAVVLPQSTKASLITGIQSARSRSPARVNCSTGSGPAFLSARSVRATRGPRIMAPITASISRLSPSRGVKTKKTIASAGMFIVAEPCTMAMAPSMPALRWNAAETGTTHAEQRFITGPAAIPLAVRLRIPPDWKPTPRAAVNRNDSASPATTNANVMPTATRRKYVREKVHHLVRKLVPGSRSMQKPWKHWTFGDSTMARSTPTASSLGIRLNARKRPRMMRNRTIPTALFLPMAVSSIDPRPGPRLPFAAMLSSEALRIF